MPREVPIVAKMYDVVKWLLPQMAKLPRAHKFTLGDRITNLALEILQLLIDASFLRLKRHPLAEVNRKLTQLRYLLRLCRDLELWSLTRYEYIAREIDEVGRMLGGWLKQQGGHDGSQ